jgi:hypothetical protein
MPLQQMPYVQYPQFPQYQAMPYQQFIQQGQPFMPAPTLQVQQMGAQPVHTTSGTLNSGTLVQALFLYRPKKKELPAVLH